MSQNKIPYNIHPLILVLPSKVTLNFLFHIRTLELPKDGCLFFSRLHLCCFINCFPRLLLPDSLLFCGSPLSSLLFVRICFNFASDQKISASLTKERLNGIQYKVIMPASLRVVPQIHLEDYSNTHHWGAKGVSDNMVNHHCHPQLHSSPAFPTCLAPLMFEPISMIYFRKLCLLYSIPGCRRTVES